MDLGIFIDIAQIIFADIVLSGDNALVIGMAAAGLSPELRKRAIFIGMALAAGMRIGFAVIASYLLSIPGILIVGGILLSWVCWRFYKDIKEFTGFDEEAAKQKADDGQPNSFRRALFTILLADVSMSIDNIVAVAAIARDNTQLLVFGLGLAILMMAFFANIIMRVMLRYRWLSWLGLFLLVYLSAKMFYDGFIDIGWL